MISIGFKPFRAPISPLDNVARNAKAGQVRWTGGGGLIMVEERRPSVARTAARRPAPNTVGCASRETPMTTADWQHPRALGRVVTIVRSLPIPCGKKKNKSAACEQKALYNIGKAARDYRARRAGASAPGEAHVDRSTNGSPVPASGIPPARPSKAEATTADREPLRLDDTPRLISDKGQLCTNDASRRLHIAISLH